jgi:hypothetical protein
MSRVVIDWAAVATPPLCAPGYVDFSSSCTLRGARIASAAGVAGHRQEELL